MMRSFSHSLARGMVALGLFAALVSACSNTETRTQLTFSISASSALQARIATLSVVIRSNNVGDQSHDFPASALTVWPVEIVVTPVTGNHSTDEVTLIVSASDANNAQVVPPITVVGKFVPEKLRLVPVPLDPTNPDGGTDGGKDAGSPDTGPGPISEGDGGPGPVGEPDAGTEPMGDGGSGTLTNCASAGSAIKCDDLNPCNGTERCEPGNSGANNDGCVKGTDVVSCANGSTCDSATGLCSTCLTNADGDKDGVASVSCGGTDCNDSDATIAPGKPELCDGKDNDCDTVIDGVAADPSCLSAAPTGGTATCVAARCAPKCTDPTYQITNNACVPPPTSCPIINPCAPGSCIGGVAGAYTCDCSTQPGYRAGLGQSRCAKQGVPAFDLGFESKCDGSALPAFTGETMSLAPTQFAACGVASITSGSMVVAPALIRPLPMGTVIEGITKATALASTGTSTGSSQLVFAFNPAVTSLSFDILGVTDKTAVSIVATAGTDMTSTPELAASQMHLHFAKTYPAPVTRLTVTYTVAAMAADQFYVDELTFSVAGCGDGIRDVAAGEACDDGNSVQCDGCDNACVVNTPNVTCTP